MSTTNIRSLTKTEKLYPTKQQFPLLPSLKQVPSSPVPRFMFPFRVPAHATNSLIGLSLIFAVRFSRALGNLHLHLFVKMRELQNYYRLGTISFSLLKKICSSSTNSKNIIKRLFLIYCLRSSFQKVYTVRPTHEK